MSNERLLEAKSLYGQKDYSGALKVYESIMNAHVDGFDQSCLFPYVWCLYRVHIGPFKEPANQMHEDMKAAIAFIMKHTTKEMPIYQITVMKLIDGYTKQASFPAEKVHAWLNRLDPDLLSNQEKIYENPNGQKIIYISPREKWYALQSKATFEIGHYQDCIDVSQLALSKLNKFYYDHDFWFEVRIARAYLGLELYDEAITLFKKLIIKKPLWFIYDNMAQAYEKQGKIKQETNMLMEALLVPKVEDAMRIRSIKRLAHIMTEMDPDKSQLLYDYYCMIKVDLDWHMGAKDELYFNKNYDRLKSQSLSQMKKAVYQFLDQLKWSKKNQIHGHIDVILPGQKAGFIATKNKSYYFRVNNIVNNQQLIDIGVPVTFYLEKSFNEKKQEESWQAVRIHIEETQLV